MSANTTSLERLPDWEDRWLQFVATAARSPLVWGQDDCMIMIGRNVEALTGENFYSEHIGQYETEEEAFRYLASLGWRLPEQMVDDTLPEIPVAFAQRGDIVSYQHCLGVNLGTKALFKGLDGENGDMPAFVSPLSTDKAWRVG